MRILVATRDDVLVVDPSCGAEAARKGWVTVEDVLNALPVAEFRATLRRNRG
jgi:hypothetical protein